MKQLYDLYTGTNDLEFVMRAPLPVIASHLNCRREAVDRIKQETDVIGGRCELYGRNNESHTVIKADGPLEHVLDF